MNYLGWIQDKINTDSDSGVRMGGWSIGHPPPTPTTLEKFLRTPLDHHLVHIDDKNTVTKTLLKPGETIF